MSLILTSCASHICILTPHIIKCFLNVCLLNVCYEPLNMYNYVINSVPKNSSVAGIPKISI